MIGGTQLFIIVIFKNDELFYSFDQKLVRICQIRTFTLTFKLKKGQLKPGMTRPLPAGKIMPTKTFSNAL